MRILAGNWLDVSDHNVYENFKVAVQCDKMSPVSECVAVLIGGVWRQFTSWEPLEGVKYWYPLPGYGVRGCEVHGKAGAQCEYAT